jgi:hypothetical protein
VPPHPLRCSDDALCASIGSKDASCELFLAGALQRNSVLSVTMATDRERMLARRRVLVGSVLTLGEQDHEAVEASFETHFSVHLRDERFWLAFKQACAAVRDGESWAMQRQLLLAFSLPQQVNGKDTRVRYLAAQLASGGNEKADREVADRARRC